MTEQQTAMNVYLTVPTDRPESLASTAGVLGTVKPTGFMPGAVFAWNCLEATAAKIDNPEVSNTVREFLMRAWHHEVLPAVNAADGVLGDGPLNGIAATMHHDEGAYAQCGECGRYTLDPFCLSAKPRPCECGSVHGWSGSFKRPGPDAKWSGASGVQGAGHCDYQHLLNKPRCTQQCATCAGVDRANGVPVSGHQVIPPTGTDE